MTQDIFEEVPSMTPAEEIHYMQQWLPLVKRIVRQLATQANSIMDREDIEQVALMGLLESLRRYGHPDAQFASYAMQRIRGAVLDQFRQHDWRPRSLRQQTHKINDVIREMTRQLGREPSEAEVCQRTGLSHASWHQYLLSESASVLESFDELLSGDTRSAGLVGRELEEEIDIEHTLALALDSLDEREKVILTLYYQKDMSLREIAGVLDLTEARICQINKKISEKIRAFFR